MTEKSTLISFYKMSGHGNDFIIIDNRDLSLQIVDLPLFVRRVCQRKVSVGADGLLLVEPSSTADFKWRFFNADGSAAEMCGNAARCVARWAADQGIAGPSLTFETQAGVIAASVCDDSVKIRLTDPSALQPGVKITTQRRMVAVDFIDTGVPHAVLFETSVADSDVVGLGRQIRFAEEFQPKGANADFAQVLDRQTMKVRTYERGVEGETLACGTGVVASVLAASFHDLVDSPVEVDVQSGERLRVYFLRQGDGRFGEIYLEGKVKMVYQGLLFEEAYK